MMDCSIEEDIRTGHEEFDFLLGNPERRDTVRLYPSASCAVPGDGGSDSHGVGEDPAGRGWFFISI